jgi:precorrin-8X/cobalt-precorrin-8 methylmutase
MTLHLSPEEIETESFRLIDAEIGPHQWSPDQWPVVRRVIHTSADFEYGQSLVFSRNAVAAGITALRNGRGIYTDTTMALAGISRPRLAKFNIKGTCLVADQEVAQRARELGVTRSLMAMRKGAADPDTGIFVLGNAPTALFELLRLIREEGVRPDMIVALPVGFVGAAESKAALLELDSVCPSIPYITNRGRKGGSNVVAAIINALLIMAIDRE